MRKFVLRNSPVEFVVSGPAGGRDQIVVQSYNAGLELVGLAANPDLLRHGGELDNSSPFDFLPWTRNSDWSHVVSSLRLPDIEEGTDRRPSSFKFVWKGFALRRGIREIEELFNLHAPELHLALIKGDADAINWAISPVIARCHAINLRKERAGSMAQILIWPLAISLFAASLVSIVADAGLKNPKVVDAICGKIKENSVKLPSP